MKDYAYDGTPLQSGLEAPNLTGSFPQFSILGHREMVVVGRRYVKDNLNRSKAQVEYTVRDLKTGDLFPGARRADQMGGTLDGDDDVLHPATTLLTNQSGEVDAQTPAVKTDGDRVLVAFIEGSRSLPVIIGVLRHPDAKYGATVEDGERRLTLHKGTSVEIKKDGQYVITHKTGATININNDGDVQVKPAAGRDVFIGDQGATENLVLGQAFKTFASSLIDALLAATYPTGTGPSGPMLPPSAVTLNQLKAQLDTLLSDMAFTQKEQS